MFDKALSETVFCELYATLCQDLNGKLPEFDPEPGQEDQKKVNFRRSLLNKCQVEFEQGAAAIQAVKAREAADANTKVRSCALSLNCECKLVLFQLWPKAFVLKERHTFSPAIRVFGWRTFELNSGKEKEKKNI